MSYKRDCEEEMGCSQCDANAREIISLKKALERILEANGSGEMYTIAKRALNIK
jgi:hypothetical protein